MEEHPVRVWRFRVESGPLAREYGLNTQVEPLRILEVAVRGTLCDRVSSEKPIAGLTCGQGILGKLARADQRKAGGRSPRWEASSQDRPQNNEDNRACKVYPGLRHGIITTRDINWVRCEKLRILFPKFPLVLVYHFIAGAEFPTGTKELRLG
jgi:hypothetical protein